ncbi:NUDIX domain-containing protein [Haloglomus litoreum]|uniref:NUDIX domain-containing protein n=1 Tax=Haloglomus litoreum TaxID=3034026 RepID=UPI0023E75F43|nr:NUDIX domain-containing protein [Haloglomus sp. DT116]
MESLHDPQTLLDTPGVAFDEERTVDDPDDFAYYESLAGMLAVGVTSHDGAVLLMESPHGWRLPYGPVEAGADWLAATRRIARQLTGESVDAGGVERVTRHVREHADDEGRETVTLDVVVGAGPVPGRPVAEDPTFDPWENLTVAWFDTVPEDAYHDHGDAVADIRRFLD